MFDTVLVANRGEIAVRVIDTLSLMGIQSIAVYSDADAGSLHIRKASFAVRIGPANAAESYLCIPNIVRAARDFGAQAVHPGYGFLAENPEFARACTESGLVFIGPGASAIEEMGDKILAKKTVSVAGVPVVPGKSDVDLEGLCDSHAEAITAAAADVGYPLLLKPSAGGGGKGMRMVESPEGLPDAVESARREAQSAFGDDRLLLERFIAKPRHIEIQILADTHGNVIHLGERECSLQRRHQKIVEEAPSPLLDDATRDAMGAAAVNAARSVGYVGVGTVEFIVSADAPDEFFFMEMNTRLQVEHPVTEMITGLDLVEWQLRVAAGDQLPVSQGDIRLMGHAIEARVYAEDPTRDFMPTGGKVLSLAEPDGKHVRVDSWLSTGADIGTHYDPMLAKVIAWGTDRRSALRRIDRALADTAVLGVGTNITFLRALLAEQDVQSGRLDTELVARRLPTLLDTAVPDEFFVAAAIERLIELEPVDAVIDPWRIATGWRLSESGGLTFRLSVGDAEAVVRVRVGKHDLTVTLDDREVVQVAVVGEGSRDDGRLELWYAGEFRRYRRANAADGSLWLARDGRCVAIGERPNLLATHEASVFAGPVTSPMPGSVLVVQVSKGDRVLAGTALVVVEAMKMEHTITAPVDGVVSELFVHAGQQVGLDERLAVVQPEEHIS